MPRLGGGALAHSHQGHTPGVLIEDGNHTILTSCVAGDCGAMNDVARGGRRLGRSIPVHEDERGTNTLLDEVELDSVGGDRMPLGPRIRHI